MDIYYDLLCARIIYIQSISINQNQMFNAPHVGVSDKVKLGEALYKLLDKMRYNNCKKLGPDEHKEYSNFKC